MTTLYQSRTGQPKIHPYEQRGLGTAPYRFVGVRKNVYSPVPEVQQPGGTCSYCGTGILFEFCIRSSEGKEYTIGSECIRKVDSEIYQPSEFILALRNHERDQRHDRETRQLAELTPIFFSPEYQQLFDGQPHPNKFYAEQGSTKWDYMKFCWNASGSRGKIAMGKMAKKRLAE